MRLGVRCGLVLALALGGTGPPSDYADERTPPTQLAKPKIIFIMLDDLGYGSLGAYGSELIRTPNIDQLARDGMLFTRYYTNSPVCSPTRVALLTGLYPQRLTFRNVVNRFGNLQGIPADFATLPELLRQEGYATAHIGKWHVGSEREDFRPEAKGYDETVRHVPGTGYLPATVKINDGTIHVVPDHLTRVLTQSAISFIEQNRDRPFFVNLWYLAPHKPLDEAPPEWANQYPNTELGRYAAHISHADENIGRLLETVDRLGLYGQTLVVVTSDNGGYPTDGNCSTNGPLRSGKPHLFEGGIRVPMIIRWPGKVAPGSTSDSVIVSFDFVPTLAALAGVDVAALAVDGKRFDEILVSGGEQPREEILFWEHKKPSRGYTLAARWDHWKLFVNGGFMQLFDLELDPAEERNVARSHPDVVDTLVEAYSTWREQAGRIDHEVERLEGDATVIDERFVFGEEGGRITLADDARLDCSIDDFTFSTWIRLSGDATTDAVIARKDGSWDLRVDGEGRVVLTVEGDEPAKIANEDPLEPALWHHLGFTMFADRVTKTKVRLFVLDEVNEETTGELPRQVAGAVVVGNDDALAAPLVGELCDVTFYGTALSDEEIARRWAQGRAECTGEETSLPLRSSR